MLEISQKAYLNHKGYGILKETVNDELDKLLTDELMVKPNMPPDYDFGNPLFPVFRKTPLRIYVPKFYGIDKFGIPDRINEREGKDAKIKFKGELRPYQQKFTKKMLKHIEKNGSCIAALSTGFGKTIIALWIASQIKKKNTYNCTQRIPVRSVEKQN